MSKEICHVCGKVKKPYTVFLTDDILSYIDYESAREDGPICERCDNYFAMTGLFKDSTEEEFELAKQSVKFSKQMYDWWNNKEKLDYDGNNSRDWDGTFNLRKWFRNYYK